MPRRRRIHLSDVPLHIVQRGHNRAPCFFTDDDYETYLYWLRRGIAAKGIALHAYVLMTNHVHLLLTPPDNRAVPDLFISLGRRYVQYINRTYRRTGTLWDSRYKSSLIQTESYLLCCQRYIELNPVRAAIVADPVQYRWSSYRCHALGQTNAMLASRAEYLALGTSAQARQDAYRALFRDMLDQQAIASIRIALAQNRPLGNSDFLSMIEDVTGYRCAPRQRGRPPAQRSGTVTAPDAQLRVAR